MKYVVQREVGIDDGREVEPTSDVFTAWVDIATVEVEPRTKRSTVLKRALAEANIPASDTPPKLRALDAESAEVHEPEAYQPPMEWRL